MIGRQYTVRGISEDLDRRLRDEARTAHKSLNEVVVATLRAAKLPAEGEEPHTDLDWFIGGNQAAAEGERAEAQAWLDAVPREVE